VRVLSKYEACLLVQTQILIKEKKKKSFYPPLLFLMPLTPFCRQKISISYIIFFVIKGFLWHFKMLVCWWWILSFLFIYLLYFCGTGAWTQGLHLEPLCQPFVEKGFVKIGSHGTICLGWLWTVILLISASWVARITGVRHQWLALSVLFIAEKILLFSLLRVACTDHRFHGW
jgi:hypothetical protein